MGITYTLLKGIPFDRHLDSFELRNRKDHSYREVTLDEYLSAEKSWMAHLGEPLSDVQELPQIGRKWNGLFTEAKEVVLQKIAFTGEPFVHQRGRYDCLSPEVAKEFEEKLLQDVTWYDWERVLRFTAGKVNKNEPIGLISILQHPAVGPDNSFNSQDIFKKLVQKAVQYESEILTVYCRGDFAKQWPFRETESGLVIADRSGEIGGELGLISPGSAPYHTRIAANYAGLIPPKESCMFFSFTAYNNELLGDEKEVSGRECFSEAGNFGNEEERPF